jgi:hypothetical protein
MTIVYLVLAKQRLVWGFVRDVAREIAIKKSLRIAEKSSN